MAEHQMGNDSLLRRVEHDFRYHPPRTDQTVKAHEEVRSVLGEVGKHLVRVTPAGREQSTMLTKIEEAMFWANAAIARQAAQPVAATSSQ